MISNSHKSSPQFVRQNPIRNQTINLKLPFLSKKLYTTKNNTRQGNYSKNNIHVSSRKIICFPKAAYRRKSFAEYESSKQKKFGTLYPKTIVQYHVKRDIRRKALFKKFSDILLKHTTIIRYLSFWSKKQEMLSSRMYSGMNPILLLKKLKEDAQSYKQMNANQTQQLQITKLEEDILKLQQTIDEREEAISDVSSIISSSVAEHQIHFVKPNFLVLNMMKKNTLPSNIKKYLENRIATQTEIGYQSQPKSSLPSSLVQISSEGQQSSKQKSLGSLNKLKPYLQKQSPYMKKPKLLKPQNFRIH